MEGETRTEKRGANQIEANRESLDAAWHAAAEPWSGLVWFPLLALLAVDLVMGGDPVTSLPFYLPPPITDSEYIS